MRLTRSNSRPSTILWSSKFYRPSTILRSSKFYRLSKSLARLATDYSTTRMAILDLRTGLARPRCPKLYRFSGSLAWLASVDGSDTNVDGSNTIMERAYATVLVVFGNYDKVEVEVVEYCRWGHPMRLTTSFPLTVK